MQPFYQPQPAAMNQTNHSQISHFQMPSASAAQTLQQAPHFLVPPAQSLYQTAPFLAPPAQSVYQAAPYPAPATQSLYQATPYPAPATQSLYQATPFLAQSLYQAAPFVAPATQSVYQATPFLTPAPQSLYQATPFLAPATQSLNQTAPFVAPATQSLHQAAPFPASAPQSPASTSQSLQQTPPCPVSLPFPSRVIYLETKSGDFVEVDVKDLRIVQYILEVAKEKFPRDFGHVLSATSLRLYKDSGFSEIVHARTPSHELLFSKPPLPSEPPTFYVDVAPGVGAKTLGILHFSIGSLFVCCVTVDAPKTEKQRFRDSAFAFFAFVFFTGLYDSAILGVTYVSIESGGIRPEISGLWIQFLFFVLGHIGEPLYVFIQRRTIRRPAVKDKKDEKKLRIGTGGCRSAVARSKH